MSRGVQLAQTPTNYNRSATKRVGNLAYTRSSRQGRMGMARTTLSVTRAVRSCLAATLPRPNCAPWAIRPFQLLRHQPFSHVHSVPDVAAPLSSRSHLAFSCFCRS